MLNKFRYFLVIFLQLSLVSPAIAEISSKQSMVVTSQYLATNVGLNILKQGGNAIDAAVAIGYALAVVDPCCGNIGGGGFMLIHLANGANTFINFRESAPAASSAKLYLDSNGKPLPNSITQGYRAVAIPGTVSGLNYALAKYGTMTLKQIIMPAINLAKKGFKLNQYDVKALQPLISDFKTQPNIAAIFSRQGLSYETGDRLIQVDLANSLKQIAKQGSAAFYRGNIAQQIVQAGNKNNGVITLKDLASYKTEELTPITCTYHGYQIISAPPPSAGGVTLCEMLGILQPYPLQQLGFHTSQSTHYVLEAMRFAYADRNHYLGDPDFVNNPIQQLLSEPYLTNIRNKIDSNKAYDSNKIKFTLTTNEKDKTTHYSIVDRFGNAVSVTYTLNGMFGAQVIAGNTGFFLNNEMDDFTLTPTTPNQFLLVQGKANLIEPGKRPLSSMTPTIVLKNNKLFMVLGTPGGSTITTQVLQVLLNVLDYHMPLQSAVNAPRYHMQDFPDIVYMEPESFSSATLKTLQKNGYHFKLGSPYKMLQWGSVAAILRDFQTGRLIGAMDQRHPNGSAAGS